MITSSPAEIKQWNAKVEHKKRDRHLRRMALGRYARPA